jgi:hypothetical protein
MTQVVDINPKVNRTINKEAMKTLYAATTILAFLVSCSGTDQSEVGKKVYATDNGITSSTSLEVYSYVDTLSLAEIQKSTKDIVEFKKIRNSRIGVQPHLYRTHLINYDQFYKSGNGFVGKIISVSSMSESNRSKHYKFYEVEIPKSVILEKKDKSSFDLPDPKYYKILKDRRFVKAREVLTDSTISKSFK